MGRRDLAIIVTLAALVYGWSLDWPIADSHSLRQTVTAEIARHYARDGIDLLRPQLEGMGDTIHELPIFEAGVALLYRAFGEREILGRLAAAACGLACALLLHGLLREVASREVALAAAAISLLAPVNVLYGRAYLPDLLSVAMGLAFFRVALRLLARGRPLAWEVPALAVAGALAGMLKPTHLVIFVVALAWFAGRRALRGGRLDLAWLRPVAAALALPALVTVAATIGWHKVSEAAAAGRLADDPTSVVESSLAYWFFSRGQLVSLHDWTRLVERLAIAFGPGAGLLLLAGAARSARRSEEPLVEVARGLALGCAVYLVLFFNLNMIHEYYHLPLAYGLAPLAALPLEGITRPSRRAAIALGLALSTAATVAVVAHHRRPYWPWDPLALEEGREFREAVPTGRPLTVYVPRPTNPNAPRLLYWADTLGYYAGGLDAARLEAYVRRGVTCVAVERGEGTESTIAAARARPGARVLATTEHLVVIDVPR
jgi:4-amino-4-deoxy-L-arabinose transferase-like glycosyltransferase